MSNYKPIFDHEKAVQRFMSDLNGDGVITYNLDDFSSDIVPSVYPDRYLEKCTHATVALSGCSPEATDYMIVCPYRVDRDAKNSQMVYDLDPLIITLNPETQMPSKVAVVGYHQNFEGRTQPIEGITFSDINTTVLNIQDTIITTGQELDAIPQSVEQGLHHMANYFRDEYGFEIH